MANEGEFPKGTGDILFASEANSFNDDPIILGTDCVALDHGTAATDMVINVCYGTSSTPPPVGTVTEGAIYFQYLA